MKVVAAYLLAQLGGNSSPSKASIDKILSSVGIDADGDRVEALLKELEGKDVHEVLAAGREKLSSLPAGGGGGGAVAAAAGGAAAGGNDTGGAAAKEESEESEADEDMGFSLFD